MSKRRPLPPVDAVAMREERRQRLESSGVFARLAINKAIHALYGKFTEEFQKSAIKRNLVGGFLSNQKHILKQVSSEDGCRSLWMELGRQCLIEPAWQGELHCYLFERFGSIQNLSDISEKVWRGMSKDGVLLDETRRLLDWIEAGMAGGAYALWKERPAIFDRDPLKRVINSAVHETKTNRGFSDSQKQAIYRDRLDWIGRNLYQDFVESSPHVSEAWRDQRISDWAHPSLDKWLILVWPLVLHHRWTTEELLSVIEKAFKNPITKKPLLIGKYPCGSADELGIHCRNVMGLRTGRKKGRPGHLEQRDRIPHEEVAIALRQGPENHK